MTLFEANEIEYHSGFILSGLCYPVFSFYPLYLWRIRCIFKMDLVDIKQPESTSILNK